MFGNRPFSHWPTAVAAALAFAILFELVYIVSMTLLGDDFAIGTDSVFFGVVAFGGYLVVVALVRRTEGVDTGDVDQP